MKRRLSASIEDDLLTAAEAAVREGHAPSVSALVEDAVRARLALTHRLAAMDDLIAEWDDERPMSEAAARRIAAEWRASDSVVAGPDAVRSSRDAA